MPIRTMLVLALALLAIGAGCGGSSGSDGSDDAADRLMLLDDKGAIASAQARLAEDVLEGGNLLADSKRLVERLRAAAEVGASDDYIAGEIDQAEETVTNGGCSECFDVLETAR